MSEYAIKLHGNDWNMIYEDQRAALESIHDGEPCLALQCCPIDHFWEDSDPDYIRCRQEIINKILDEFSDD